jgi:hypothetical protein
MLKVCTPYPLVVGKDEYSSIVLFSKFILLTIPQCPHVGSQNCTKSPGFTSCKLSTAKPFPFATNA